MSERGAPVSGPRFVDDSGDPVDVGALAARLLRDRPARSTPAPSTPARSTPASSTSFRSGPVRSTLGDPRRRDVSPRAIVLVDGRSGTGKTTFATVLAERMSAQVVHLDDVYPGWDGLRSAAEAVVRDVLAPPDGTGRPGFRRWDWGTGLPADWVALDPARDVVVEGCGALSRESAARATYRIWLDGDDDERRRRALDRDGEVFAREWDRWARQEEAFIAAEQPRTLADLVVRIA